MKQKIRIGCGAGFSGDRIEPAILLAEKGDLDYLVLECLAERTIALAQKRKLADKTKGYDPLLERRILTLLPLLVQNKICLISNMGAANPIEGAKKVIEIANKLNLKIKVAAVLGDEIHLSNSSTITLQDISIFSKEEFILKTIKENDTSNNIISMNAYMGVEGILQALQTDVQVIITGRVADPSLFLAPMMHEFGWKNEAYQTLGKGTIIGHLLECAGQVTGGYFADPLKKPVEKLENLGHPIAEVYSDGSAILSKINSTGGCINLQTVKEQLLYEVTDPHAYYTPDVIADFSTVTLEEIGENQVKISGGNGKQKPKTLKVSVGYKGFWQGEAEISYVGTSSFERAKLAGEIIKKRLQSSFLEIKIDFIGVSSLLNEQSKNQIFNEIRLRVAAKAKSKEDAEKIGEEVEALYTNGPAGGGGVRKYVNEVIGIASVLIDRNKIIPTIKTFTS